MLLQISECFEVFLSGREQMDWVEVIAGEVVTADT